MKSEHFIASRLAGLSQWVTTYYYGVSQAGPAVLVRRVSAHPRVFIQFVIEGTQLLRGVDTGAIVPAPAVAAFGPMENRSYEVESRSTVRVFTICLHPGAFEALFGRPVSAIVNGHLSLPEAEPLRQQLALLGSIDDMVATVDRWLAVRVLAAPRPDRIMQAAKRMMQEHGNVEIAKLAADAGYSPRQFQRAFKYKIGLTPKSFARLYRLCRAIRLHETEPGHSWTEIAFRTGFADQSHLIREFKAMLAVSPSKFQRYAVR